MHQQTEYLPPPSAATDGPLPWPAHFRRFLSFVGPTWLIAVTFVDPGGLAGALQQGSETRFALLWISWWSIVFGYVFQILATHCAIVSGKSLAQLVIERYPKRLQRYAIWVFIEGSVFGDDIQACVGSAIALQIMTRLPWWAATLLTLAVSLALSIAYYWNATWLEMAVGAMTLGMLILVWINVGHGHANAGDVLEGWVVPKIPSGQVLTIVGSIGGVLTPSALYLGSTMVLTRSVNRASKRDVKRCLAYSCVELVIGMVVAFLIILAITVTFANGFYTSECAAQGLAYVPSENQCDEIALGDGPDALSSLYGRTAKYIFAMTLLLSGVGSMVSATLAGQATWEGFMDVKVAFWQRMLVTRMLVLIPTLTIAVVKGNDDVAYTRISDWVNVFMSLAMPFAVIPALDIASQRVFMKDMVLGPWRIALSALGILLLITVNFYLLARFIFDPVTFGSAGDFPSHPWFYALTGAAWLAYAYVLMMVALPGVKDIWMAGRAKLGYSSHLPGVELAYKLGDSTQSG